MKTKYLLTTSSDKDVIIAEVPSNYQYNDKSEYVVSKGFVDANVQNGTFTDMTGQLDWEGQIWVYTNDIS
jgi:hypothetical protein